MPSHLPMKGKTDGIYIDPPSNFPDFGFDVNQGIMI